MGFRQMRVFVFFDLPVLTPQDRRAYGKFHRYLTRSGFIMMQESVYTKLCLNATAAKTIYTNVKSHKPEKGLVELLTVTEKQYSSIEYIVGEASDEYVSSTERLIVL